MISASLLLSKFPVGSSAKMIKGSLTSERAIATGVVAVETSERRRPSHPLRTAIWPSRGATPAPTIAPTSYDYTASSCAGKLPSFTVSGGTPPFAVTSAPSGLTFSATNLTAAPYVFTVTGGLSNDGNVHFVVATDANGNSAVAGISCPAAP